MPPCTHPAEYECPDCKQTTDRICIICGCTDSRACHNGCSWIQLHNYGNTGVCSNCYHFALSNLTSAINESEEVVFATSNVFTPPELSAAIKSSLVSAS